MGSGRYRSSRTSGSWNEKGTGIKVTARVASRNQPKNFLLRSSGVFGSTGGGWRTPMNRSKTPQINQPSHQRMTPSVRIASTVRRDTQMYLWPNRA